MGPGKLSNVMYRALTFNTQARFPIIYTVEPIELADEKALFQRAGDRRFPLLSP